MDEEDRPSLVLAPKKEPKEEPSDNSPAKSVSGVASRGTAALKSTKGKRKSVDETKPSSNAPPKKVKTENVSDIVRPHALHDIKCVIIMCLLVLSNESV